MAAAYALSYSLGLLLTALRLRRRTEGLLDGRRICRTYAKLTAAASAAGGAGWLLVRSLPAPSTWAPVLSVTAGGLAMALLFLVFARLLRVGELRGLPGLGTG